MINYLTRKRYQEFNPYLRISKQNNGAGGMHSKIWRVNDVLNEVYYVHFISDTKDIKYRVVIIDPMRVSPVEISKTMETSEEVFKGLQSHKSQGGKIIVLCTEKTILRLDPDTREGLINIADAVTSNCQFLTSLMKYIDLEPTTTLCDPVPDDFEVIYPTKPAKPKLVTLGQISYPKNTDYLIEVYTALKEQVPELNITYVGSSRQWNTKLGTSELEHELSKVVDNLYNDATTNDVIRELHTSTLGLWVAHHDTSAQGTLEMLASGLPVLAAPHGLADELPVIICNSIPDIVDNTKRILKLTPKGWERKSKDIIKWWKQNNSYEVFLNQFQSIIRSIS